MKKLILMSILLVGCNADSSDTTNTSDNVETVENIIHSQKLGDAEYKKLKEYQIQILASYNKMCEIEVELRKKEKVLFNQYNHRKYAYEKGLNDRKMPLIIRGTLKDNMMVAYEKYLVANYEYKKIKSIMDKQEQNVAKYMEMVEHQDALRS